MPEPQPPPPPPPPASPAPAPNNLPTLLIHTLALALAAAVSLGLARFAYALLLPAMRADLGWSYFTAGAMNTVNAAGYLIGALWLPRAMARYDARALMLAGGLITAAVLALHGLARHEVVLYALRGLAGLASALSFVCGGLLAARLANSPAAVGRSGLVLGLYYGGTGLGIVASALLVPPVIALRDADWPTGWWVLAGLALLATAATVLGTRTLVAPPATSAQRQRVPLRDLRYALLGYLMFGMGYIGYMTFIISLLREQGLALGLISGFYVLLGVGVLASSFLWAGLLQRQRGGVPMAVLNGLLALATLLPVLSQEVWVVMASGLLFGSAFLSVVASTTALVRHNLPLAQWPGGIAAFTIIFAGGQIIGPSAVGWIADAAGGLQRGLACSAATLALGALLASRQRALDAR